MSDLRNKFLAGKKSIGSVVKTLSVNLNGETVAVNICRPGLRARNRCMVLVGADGQIKDFSRLQAVAVVACLRDMEGKQIFEEIDENELAEETACGDWFDEVAPLCMDLVMPTTEGNAKSSK